MSLKILLVDDHHMFLKGLRLILEQEYAHEAVVTEAATASSAWEQARELKPDLFVIDIHLPDGDGIGLSRQILAESPAAKIIILSGETHLSFINDALQAGVAGYLLKENAPDELLTAIAAVQTGKMYLCSEANTAVLNDYKQHLAAKGTAAKPVLSAREREVLQLVARGCRTKEIADHLGVGVKSVETYRRRLIKKLGCNGTVDLVRRAMRQGLVPP